MTKKICIQPFRSIVMYENKQLSCCCPLYSKSSELFKDKDSNSTLEKFWNCDDMLKLRKSFIDGDYEKYCSTCFQKSLFLKDIDKLPQNIKTFVDNKQIIINDIENIDVSFDRSCNLKCKSCRTDIISNVGGTVREQYNDTYNFLLSKNKNKIKLNINGGGDCFGYECFSFLKRIEDTLDIFPNLSFSLITNAQLFNENNANRIKKILQKTEYIVISVDSPVKETYEQIRINGNWETLIKNLTMINILCKNNKIPLVFVMVIQKLNYKEIELFKTFSDFFNASTNFIELRDWFGGRNPWFKDNAVHLPDHPLYTDYINEIKDKNIKIMK